MSPLLDPDACYRAHASRDARFDGQFFTGVRSTGVFCRPICPARTPLRRNVAFYPSAAAAIDAGFRPCRRCRPERAPSDAWGPRGLVDAALRLLDDDEPAVRTGTAPDARHVERVCARLGVSDRHLRRLFADHLGASPVAVLQTRRVLLARQMIEGSSLPLARIAYAAGFHSLRRFNAAMQSAWGCTPSALRSSRPASETEAALTLRLPYLGVYRWDALLRFIGPRAFPGVEGVADLRYRRALRLGGTIAQLEARHDPAAASIVISMQADDLQVMHALAERARRFFDVGANGPAIREHLSADPVLARVLQANDGIRIPGAWSPFELAVRAILGQQVSVAAATTFAARLVVKWGASIDVDPDIATDATRLVRTFPTPEALAEADLTTIGVIRSRAAWIRELARTLVADPDLFHRLHSLDQAVGELTRLPGIGAWTAHYIAMRALRQPDAFPTGDLGLVRAYGRLSGSTVTARELDRIAERWRPWRAYGAMALWLSEPSQGG